MSHKRQYLISAVLVATLMTTCIGCVGDRRMSLLAEFKTAVRIPNDIQANTYFAQLSDQLKSKYAAAVEKLLARCNIKKGIRIIRLHPEGSGSLCIMSLQDGTEWVISFDEHQGINAHLTPLAESVENTINLAPMTNQVCSSLRSIEISDASVYCVSIWRDNARRDFVLHQTVIAAYGFPNRLVGNEMVDQFLMSVSGLVGDFVPLENSIRTELRARQKP